MLFTTLTLLATLAPAVLSVPTPMAPVIAVDKRQYTRPLAESCDLSKAVMAVAPTALPMPTGTLAHIAVGRGTQNYTCAATPNDNTAAPKAIGAIATLYNVTCLSVVAPQVLEAVTPIALSTPMTLDKTENDGPKSGRHLFTATGAPFFETDYGWIQAKASANSSAPTTSDKGKNGLGAVAWLKLTGTAGDFTEVYRVDTAGGVAPKTCSGQTGTFEVQYAALYWFYR
ncbi:hypothetical protein P280DRAFT_295088 [Massarina eburnea CBS 473.64]|uniref:Malate dehydrogenase n=1 Tax=Massarina eburnea CBS 473.64 TaxID=1395130 RepID=A0A6A6S3M4_9PLEO|nr:hypothetical protein P280DRAFT_295088 [Massarina eburnea CBS 473.64]